ncbi:hypothetical protein HYX11_01595 [Candidatus Woesearchaeota archaeon]|nr:hypothetical protein [Candidatus Woesearchaeota archaeon]
MDEDFNALVMECNNCHLKFRANELKMDKMKNMLVCSNCLAFPGSKVIIIKDEAAPRAKKVQIVPERKVQQAVQKQPVKNEMAAPPSASGRLGVPPGYQAFACTVCRYEFTRKAGWRGSCPYCSKNTVRSLK